jgi:hypothetical protein
MNCWNELLDHLAEVPRENGTPALHQSASYLVEAFRAAGIEAQRFPYTAHPYETRFLGLFVLVICVLYFFFLCTGKAPFGGRPALSSDSRGCSPRCGLDPDRLALLISESILPKRVSTAAPPTSSAYLLQGLKIFHYVAPRKHSDEFVSQHDRHLINSVPTHLFHCCPQFCVGIDSA